MTVYVCGTWGPCELVDWSLRAKKALCCQERANVTPASLVLLRGFFFFFFFFLEDRHLCPLLFPTPDSWPATDPEIDSIFPTLNHSRPFVGGEKKKKKKKWEKGRLCHNCQVLKTQHCDRNQSFGNTFRRLISEQQPSYWLWKKWQSGNVFAPLGSSRCSCLCHLARAKRAHPPNPARSTILKQSRKGAVSGCVRWARVPLFSSLRRWQPESAWMCLILLTVSCLSVTREVLIAAQGKKKNINKERTILAECLYSAAVTEKESPPALQTCPLCK